MEEKESTVSVSGSPGNTESGSPQPMSSSIPHLLNMNVEYSGGATAPPPVVATAVTAMAATPGSTGGGRGSLDLFGKKKRGRPRKYDADGNLRMTYKHSGIPQGGSGFSLSPSEFSASSSKRGRGRPTGSGNWQLLASLGEMFANTAGGDFTPHVVTVYTGEDVAGKILSFSQKGPRGICILSANGSISNVTLRQPGSSGGLLTYEGRFEILSLSGSFTVSDNSGIRSRTGGLSVSLAGPDGRVIGGGVAGLLTAASPIQIVVGSFIPNGYKTNKRKHQREHSAVSPISGAPDTVTAARPISEAHPGGVNCLTPSSLLPEQNQRECDNITNDKLNLDATANVAEWNGSGDLSVQRPYPDINISLPGE